MTQDKETVLHIRQELIPNTGGVQNGKSMEGRVGVKIAEIS